MNFDLLYKTGWAKSFEPDNEKDDLSIVKKNSYMTLAQFVKLKKLTQTSYLTLMSCVLVFKYTCITLYKKSAL